jgi:hypothetical protein
MPDQLTDPEARKTVLGIAKGYDRLVERAQIRAGKDSK